MDRHDSRIFDQGHQTPTVLTFLRGARVNRRGDLARRVGGWSSGSFREAMNAAADGSSGSTSPLFNPCAMPAPKGTLLTPDAVGQIDRPVGQAGRRREHRNCHSRDPGDEEQLAQVRLLSVLLVPLARDYTVLFFPDSWFAA